MVKQTIVYKEKKGYAIKADFYGTGVGQAPIVVYIHGGGLIWGSREDLSEDMLKLFLDHGFAVFSIDYRLAPESKLADILEDVQDALSWLESDGAKQFSIDPGRIFVVGGSAGGFLALCTGTFKNKPRAIVSFYGYGDISGNWAVKPSSFYLGKELISRELAYQLVSEGVLTEGPVGERYLIYLYARQHGVWVEEITGLNPAANHEALIGYCPLHNVSSEYPPTLFLHGTKDTDVPYEQSVYMRAALVRNSVYTKLITIPNGEHVFEKDFDDPIVQSALQEMIGFLRGGD